MGNNKQRALSYFDFESKWCKGLMASSGSTFIIDSMKERNKGLIISWNWKN